MDCGRSRDPLVCRLLPGRWDCKVAHPIPAAGPSSPALPARSIMWAGHFEMYSNWLATESIQKITQRYIDGDTDAQRAPRRDHLNHFPKVH